MTGTPSREPENKDPEGDNVPEPGEPGPTVPSPGEPGGAGQGDYNLDKDLHTKEEFPDAFAKPAGGESIDLDTEPGNPNASLLGNGTDPETATIFDIIDFDGVKFVDANGVEINDDNPLTVRRIF
ncbi:MAG: hypothetical protein GX834_01540 [Clostridiaceae bacterium]|nr:hypothetical protein [Clostridiaceae bacterium]